MSAQTELDVDSPEHAVDRFLEARELEISFLVDGEGWWWLFRADTNTWVCAVGPEDATNKVHMAQEVEGALLKSNWGAAKGSAHKGFDEGAALVGRGFAGIAS